MHDWNIVRVSQRREFLNCFVGDFYRWLVMNCNFIFKCCIPFDKWSQGVCKRQYEIFVMYTFWLIFNSQLD